ncbi:MAG: sulfotransferase [Verrucomicrobiota bacterium]
MSATERLKEAALQPPPPLHPLGGSEINSFHTHWEENEPFSKRTESMRKACRASIVARRPFTAYEKWRWGKEVSERTFEKDPVMILGHWRSGTTHLHNLLSQDPQFGWLSFYQANMPLNMLGKKVALGRFIMKQSIPKTRGFDNVSLGLDTPQEDDLALANLNPISEFKIYYFPREAKRHFYESVFFKGLSDEAVERFTQAYLGLLKKLDYYHQGKQLLLKNPASTGRIPFLLKHFPNTKFVHIVRNPFKVFTSSAGLYVGALPAFSWQDFEEFDIEDHVYEFYEQIMNRYLKERSLIPPENLIEIRFEDLTKDPLGQVTRVYDQFGLPGRETGLARVTDYIEATKDYKKNIHQITESQVATIRDRWGFAFDAWGYSNEPSGIEVVP